MTNKQNTIVFILLGTIANIIISLFITIVMTVLGTLILKQNVVYGLPLFLLAGIVLGLLVYKWLATWVIKKWNLEDKLDPLFSPRNRKRPSRRD